MISNTVKTLIVVAVVGFILMRKASNTQVFVEPSKMTDDELYKEFTKTYWKLRSQVEKIAGEEKQRWQDVLQEVESRGKIVDWLSKAQMP